MRQASGGVALSLLVPNLSEISWEEILELREHPALENLRRHMVEVEEEVDHLSGDPALMKEAIHRKVEFDLASGFKAPSKIAVVGKIVLTAILGKLPGIGDLANAVTEFGDADLKTRDWRAMFLAIREAEGRAHPTGRSRTVARKRSRKRT